MTHALEEAANCVTIRTPDLLQYIRRKTGRADPLDEVMSLLQLDPEAPPDWHRILREGTRSPLHLNLGIPGIERPDHPIEENPAALYAAILLKVPTLQVILSGEIELAQEEGLITVKALHKLRKKIRE